MTSRPQEMPNNDIQDAINTSAVLVATLDNLGADLEIITKNVKVVTSDLGNALARTSISNASIFFDALASLVSSKEEDELGR